MFVIRDIVYLMALIVCLPVILFRRLTREKYRSGLAGRLGGVPRRTGAKPCLWVHGVSVGEVLAARALIDGWRGRHDDWDVVISSTTDTGAAAARRTFPDRLVVHYPMDFSWAVSQALSRIRPTLVVLMECEVWPNFLRFASARGVPVVVANGRISDRSFPRSKRLRFFLSGAFARLTRVAAQSEEYASRFEALGTPRGRIAVTGSLKYDALENVPDPEPLRHALGIDENDPVLVAGSTTEGEEETLLDVYAHLRREFPTLRLAIVPRHPERFDAVAQLIRAKGFRCLRRTCSLVGGDLRVPLHLPNAQEGPHAGGPLQEEAVILGDTMGELMTFYALATVAFVGKSLLAPGGGQNMIEPASLGKPVVFGPYTSNFRETRDVLVSREAAREVKDAAELSSALTQLLADKGLRAELGSRARAVVDASRGATGRTLDILEDVLASAAKSL